MSLWQFRRREIARGVAIGLFFGCLPIPIQMFSACILALITRANLPMALLCVWITNPLTITPMLYLEYHIGHWMLNDMAMPLQIHWTWTWMGQAFSQIWKPLLLGSLMFGLAVGGLGYLVVMSLWRYFVQQEWQAKHPSDIS